LDYQRSGVKNMIKENLHNYTSAYDQLAVTQQVPSWLKEFQSEGIKRFGMLGFPSRKNEEWRYTNVSSIAESQIHLVDASHDEDLPLSGSALDFLNLFFHRVVFVNGLFSKALSQFSEIDKKIYVSDLATEIHNNNPDLKAYFAKYQNEDAFTSLNKAFSGQGAFIQINQDASLDQPIHILYLNRPSSNRAQLISPRTFVTVGKFSRVKLLESYISFDSGDYFTNAVTDIYVQESAHLEHCKIQAEASDAFHVGSVRIQQDSDSQVETFNFSIGSKIGRNNLDVSLNGEGAYVSLDGLYATKEKQHIDNHTVVDHIVPHTTSCQIYKGILGDESHAVFNGKVYVRQDAQKTDSQQLNKNLLLSKKAVIDTKPQLEISANDVKCTHGATVGQINQDELFYFQSRAIPEDLARKLLVYGFADEVLARVKNSKIRETLGELLKERYYVD